MLQTVKLTEKLSTTNLDQWPTYSAVIAKCKQENGEIVYQSQEGKNVTAAKAYFARHYVEYCTKVTECIKARLSRDIIFVLTHGWQKAVDEYDPLEAVDRLVQNFSILLESTGADVGEIHAEFEAMLQYATMFISLYTSDSFCVVVPLQCTMCV